MFQAKKCTVTKYIMQTDINSLTPFNATDVPYTSCTGTSVYYISLRIYTHTYVHTHMKLFHNTSYLIRQKKSTRNSLITELKISVPLFYIGKVCSHTKYCLWNDFIIYFIISESLF
jgi:hypothetical protein